MGFLLDGLFQPHGALGASRKDVSDAIEAAQRAQMLPARTRVDEAIERAQRTPYPTREWAMALFTNQEPIASGADNVRWGSNAKANVRRQHHEGAIYYSMTWRHELLKGRQYIIPSAFDSFVQRIRKEYPKSVPSVSAVRAPRALHLRFWVQALPGEVSDKALAEAKQLGGFGRLSRLWDR